MPEFIPIDRLLEETGRDPLVVASVANGRLTGGAWVESGTYVWNTMHWGAAGYMGIGNAALAAGLVGDLSRTRPGERRRVSLPHGWLEHADRALGAEPESDWDWFWTTSAPEGSDGHHPHWLTDDDEPDVRKVLADAMPSASAQPGDDRVRRWAGIRNEAGELVACLADTSSSDRIGHLASVVTATRHQSNGYGAALTSWVTREMLREGAHMVTLGMYARNHGARRFYERLGFSCAHRFSAAWIRPDRSDRAGGPSTVRDAALD